MRLCIATPWDDAWLARVAGLARGDDRVHEVFGSLPRSVPGSARDGAILPAVDAAGVRRHIAAAHALGIRFNYLVNSSCMGGSELLPEGRSKLLDYFRWIADAGADSVTVTIPYLMELAQTAAPGLEVVVSTIDHVDSVRRARFYRDLGARRATLSLMVNRDLASIRRIVRSGGLEVELLVNEMCLYECPYRAYHYDLMAHGSQGTQSFASIEYPQLGCTRIRMADPVELLRARFVRPEDVARYEAAGVELFKIAGRGRSGDALLRVAEAYLSRRYEGNLLDLTDLGFHAAGGAKRPSVHVDNRALDGFLDDVAGIDCDNACGIRCRKCEAWAARAVRIGDARSYTEALDAVHADLLADVPPGRRTGGH